MFERKVSQYEECVDRIVQLHAALNEPIIVRVLWSFHFKDVSSGAEIEYSYQVSKWARAWSPIWYNSRYFVLSVRVERMLQT